MRSMAVTHNGVPQLHLHQMPQARGDAGSVAAGMASTPLGP